MDIYYLHHGLYPTPTNTKESTTYTGWLEGELDENVTSKLGLSDIKNPQTKESYKYLISKDKSGYFLQTKKETGGELKLGDGAKSCNEVLSAREAIGKKPQDGKYTIFSNNNPIEVYCDMDNGGLTLAYKYNGVVADNNLFDNESSYGDISDINTNEAKLSTKDFISVASQSNEIVFKDFTLNKTYYMKYKDISSISFISPKSYNISIRDTSRPSGLWSPYYNSHEHFYLFVGISKNEFPPVCEKHSYDRLGYHSYLSDKKRWESYCLDGGFNGRGPYIMYHSKTSCNSGEIWIK